MKLMGTRTQDLTPLQTMPGADESATCSDRGSPLGTGGLLHSRSACDTVGKGSVLLRNGAGRAKASKTTLWAPLRSRPVPTVKNQIQGGRHLNGLSG